MGSVGYTIDWNTRVMYMVNGRGGVGHWEMTMSHLLLVTSTCQVAPECVLGNVGCVSVSDSASLKALKC